MANIFGWRDSRDVAALSVADYTERRTVEDLRRFRDDLNRFTLDLVAGIATTGPQVKTQFGLGTDGEMQPYAEGGAVLATRPLDKWDVAYPIYSFRSRKLYTEQALVEMTIEDLEKDTIQAAVEHIQRLQKDVLRAVMYKTNFTFDDGAEGSANIWPRSGFGSLAVKRLFNNDSAAGEVMVNGARVSIGTLQHYFGSNNGTLTQTPFETAYGKLLTVGQTDDVVFRISSSDEGAVRGLADFFPAPNANLILNNSATTFARVSDEKAIGRLEGDSVSGEVIVQPFMPAGYVLAQNRGGGPENRPVHIRVHPRAQWRGWRLVQDQTRTDYGEWALRNKQWEWIAGMGVKNRASAVAFQVVASTTYTDPSGL